MPKAHVSPLPPLRLTDVLVQLPKKRKTSDLGGLCQASTKPEEQALWRPARSHRQRVGMDGISWKGLKSETI